jgi:NAD-dependent DNA ligase
VSRTLLVEELERQGAIMQSSISSKTDLLIALENPSPAKLARAKKLGITIISIDQIRDFNVASTMANPSST